MIDILTKIHDRFSIEFKMGFRTRPRQRSGDFSVYMWIFVPNSLDINPSTYPKSKFYRDVKSNVRLITPKSVVVCFVTVRMSAPILIGSDITPFEFAMP